MYVHCLTHSLTHTNTHTCKFAASLLRNICVGLGGAYDSRCSSIMQIVVVCKSFVPVLRERGPRCACCAAIFSSFLAELFVVVVGVAGVAALSVSSHFFRCFDFFVLLAAYVVVVVCLSTSLSFVCV